MKNGGGGGGGGSANKEQSFFYKSQTFKTNVMSLKTAAGTVYSMCTPIIDSTALVK